MDGPGTVCHRGEVTAHDPCIARDRFVRLIDSIASDDEGAASDSRLRIDNRIASDHGRTAIDPPGDVEIAKENQDASGDIAFDLNRTEDTGRVVDLLSLGDEDVLIEVSSGALAMPLGPRSRNGDEKKKDEAQDSGCVGHHRFFSWRSLGTCRGVRRNLRLPMKDTHEQDKGSIKKNSGASGDSNAGVVEGVGFPVPAGRQGNGSGYAGPGRRPAR